MRGGYILDMVAIAYGLLLYYLMMIVGAYLPRRVEMSRWYRWVRHIAYVLPLGVFIFLNVSDKAITTWWSGIYGIKPLGK